MDNKELIQRLEICINEYKKLLEENKQLKQELETVTNNSNDLLICVNETNHIINDTRKDMTQALETIDELKNLINFYETVTLNMFHRLTERVLDLAKKEEIYREDISSLQTEIEEAKERVKNLNDMIF